MVMVGLFHRRPGSGTDRGLVVTGKLSKVGHGEILTYEEKIALSQRTQRRGGAEKIKIFWLFLCASAAQRSLREKVVGRSLLLASLVCTTFCCLVHPLAFQEVVVAATETVGLVTDVHQKFQTRVSSGWA